MIMEIVGWMELELLAYGAYYIGMCGYLFAEKCL